MDAPSDIAEIPADELAHLTGLIRAHPEHLSVEAVRSAYRDLGLEVLPDPNGKDVSERIAASLKASQPLSVVRIGDGETNFLAFGADPHTPVLDRYSVRQMMAGRADNFALDEAWTLALREMLVGALLQADIIGVIGVWRWRKPNPEWIVGTLSKDPRGTSGHWRAVDHMLRLARRGLFEGKALTSAHLYFGVLRHLPDLLAETDRLLLISSRGAAMDALERLYPNHQVQRITVGTTQGQQPKPATPDFLARTEAELPADLAGCLCLVGAGL